MKAKILKILNAKLIGAEDNLLRANLQFKPGTTDMNAEYFSSGRTCQDILDSYNKEVEECKKCIDWVKSR